MYGKKYRLARIILETFKGPPPTNKHQVNHYDENFHKSNKN